MIYINILILCFVPIPLFFFHFTSSLSLFIFYLFLSLSLSVLSIYLSLYIFFLSIRLSLLNFLLFSMFLSLLLYFITPSRLTSILSNKTRLFLPTATATTTTTLTGGRVAIQFRRRKYYCYHQNTK